MAYTQKQTDLKLKEQKNDLVNDFCMDETGRNRELNQSEEIDKLGSTLVYQKASKLPDDLKLEDPDIAKHFITWIKEGLQERQIKINNSKALVHIV